MSWNGRDKVKCVKSVDEGEFIKKYSDYITKKEEYVGDYRFVMTPKEEQKFRIFPVVVVLGTLLVIGVLGFWLAS